MQRFRSLRHTLVTLLNELPEIRTPEGIRLEGSFLGPRDDFDGSLRLYGQALKEKKIRAAVYGHLLENRLNLALLPENGQTEAGEALLLELGKQVCAAGGNPAAEYGTGRLRRTLVEACRAPEQLERFRAWRAVLDPHYRMNP